MGETPNEVDAEQTFSETTIPKIGDAMSEVERSVAGGVERRVMHGRLRSATRMELTVFSQTVDTFGDRIHQ
jgi:hypothetical protein